MIGTNFVSPLEFKITTNKDFYNQGDEISGTFLIKNHGTDQVNVSDLNITLAYGVIKKINKQADDAFKIMDQFDSFGKLKLSGGSEQAFDWSFELKESYPITDKQKSLYLIYGDNKNPYQCGQLQLTVEMEELLKFFLEKFVNFHRFQVKQIKFNKEMVEIKLVPPKSREMTTVNNLILRMLKDGDNLKVIYNFTMEKLESVSITEAKVQKSKKLFEQVLTRKDYEEFGSFGHDKVTAKIGEILKDVIPKFFF